MAVEAIVNRPYPNRLQLRLGSLQGPLKSLILGEFDPRRDIDIYNNGKLMVVDSFSWDPVLNRYLVFFTTTLNFDGLTQVIHHVPNPPFCVEGNPELYNLSPGTWPDILVGS